jgi:hypothetical protein
LRPGKETAPGISLASGWHRDARDRGGDATAASAAPSLAEFAWLPPPRDRGLLLTDCIINGATLLRHAILLVVHRSINPLSGGDCLFFFLFFAGKTGRLA